MLFYCCLDKSASIMDSNFTGQNRENAVKDGGLHAILRPQL